MTRIALITGGSRGLGRAMATNLARAGVSPIITYHSNAEAAEEALAEASAAGVQAAALKLDTEDTASFGDFAATLPETLAELGGEHLHALVNNAGYGAHATFEQTSEADFDAMMQVHVKGPFFLTQALLPLLADGGQVLNVSSGLTRFSYPGFAAYATAKGAVEVMTHYMAREFGPRGIAVNTLAPGAIETDFGGGIVRDDPEMNARMAEISAMGRAGLPDDIGGAVAALLAGKTNWITGQRIEASGGALL
ncbi:SDR family NAD(P)-dependent oxidoreductase [Vannielia litorea]|uniref:SDR family NAD(P)-dependent oxidoreductase n=1 Tax=Vannielia litorea TaxID=1217970 RepID=UPI001C94B1CF|nr:SDR family oxidoreductase [Vannielia litorea]MBY6049592.1 SDR family oxidoreductase [Vannielia litorea]MBY6077006.1 SDR family oxidoreductase [Vannielia litorea]